MQHGLVGCNLIDHNLTVIIAGEPENVVKQHWQLLLFRSIVVTNSSGIGRC